MTAELSHVHWMRESREPGRIPYRVGRKDGRFVAEWEGLGVLWASPDGEASELSVVPGLDPVREEKWKRGLVRGMLRHLQGCTTLHGSAVAIGGRAFVFLGDSGAGKSTCAADVCARLGADLLADDTVEVDVHSEGRLDVAPSEGAHWLLRDSAEALGYPSPVRWKDPVDAARTATSSAHLGAVVALAFGEDGSAPSLAPLEGVSAFTVINQSYIRFVFDDRAVAANDLNAIADIASAVPVLTLTRPRSLAALDRSAALLRDLADRVGASR